MSTTLEQPLLSEYEQFKLNLKPEVRDRIKEWRGGDKRLRPLWEALSTVPGIELGRPFSSDCDRDEDRPVIRFTAYSLESLHRFIGATFWMTDLGGWRISTIESLAPRPRQNLPRFSFHYASELGKYPNEPTSWAGAYERLNVHDNSFWFPELFRWAEKRSGPWQSQFEAEQVARTRSQYGY